MIIWNNYMLLANEGTFMIINVIRVHLEQVWCCFRERDELRSHHGHQCENFLDQLHISDTSQ